APDGAGGGALRSLPRVPAGAPGRAAPSVKRLLFGGSFDPVHCGHVGLAESAARALGADRVSLIPAADAPHKRGAAVAGASDRLEMCRRAAAGHPLLDVLDVEVRRGGISYTVDTVL